METWDNDDHETPIEAFPGYLGHTMDYDFFPGSELEPLENINGWEQIFKEYVRKAYWIAGLLEIRVSEKS